MIKFKKTKSPLIKGFVVDIGNTVGLRIRAKRAWPFIHLRVKRAQSTETTEDTTYFQEEFEALKETTNKKWASGAVRSSSYADVWVRSK